MNDARPAPLSFFCSATLISILALAAPARAQPQVRVTLGNATAIPHNSLFNVGTTSIGVPLVKSIRVHNDGDADLHVSSLTVPSGYAVGNPLDSVILPGTSDNFGLTLTATGEGTFTGRVRIHHDGGNVSTPYKFDVTGTVTGNGTSGPRVRVTLGNATPIPPQSLFDVGVTVVGTTLVRSIRVHNDGDTNLNLSGLTVPQGYSVGNPLRAVVAPGSSDNFGLILTATSSGIFTGQVRFQHDAGNESTPYRFDVTGTVTGNSGGNAPRVRVTLGNATPIPYGSLFDVGSTPVGWPLVKSIRVHNDGGSDLHVGSLIVPQGFAVGNPLDAVIEPGTSDNFGLVLSATSEGVFSGRVRFDHDADDESTPYEFDVTGTVVGGASSEPRIRVTLGNATPIPHGSLFDVGNTDAGSPHVRSIRVHNDGDADLQVSGLTLPPGFSLGNPLDPVIPPGTSDNFGLVLSAGGEGTFTGEVRFQHDAMNEPTPYRFQVTGTVDPAPGGGSEGPRVRVTRGHSTPIPYDGSLDLGTSTVGTAIAVSLRVHNEGDADLHVGGLTVPTGFSIGNPLDPVIPPGTSENFGLVLEAGTEGFFSGEVRFHHDGLENPTPYKFWVTGMVTDQPSSASLLRVTQGAGSSIPFQGTLNMGTTGVGSAIAKSLRVYNDGDRDLHLGSLVLPAGYSIGSPLDSVIAPGTYDSFGLVLDATSSGTFAGVLSFHHDASNESTPFLFTVLGTVTGNGSTGPEVRVALEGGAPIPYEATVDLGTTAVGTPVLRDVRVHNDGDLDLHVQDLVLPAGYTLGSPLDGVILPGEEGSFELVLDASSEGTYSGQVRFRHDATNEPSPFLFSVVARVLASDGGLPADPPVIASLSRRTIPLGDVTTLTLFGRNLTGTEVTVPPMWSASNTPPEILSVTHSPSGDRIDLEIDASSGSNEGMWALAVAHPDVPLEAAGTDFRVVPDHPVIDLWTPTQPLIGALMPLFITGANLKGATVRATHSAISISDVDSSQDEMLTGFLMVEPGSNPVGAQLIVSQGNGSSVTLDLDIVAATEVPQESHSFLSEDPPVCFQEVRFREGKTRIAAEPPPPPVIDFCFYVSFSRSLSQRAVDLRMNLLDDVGEPNQDALSGLTPGEMRQFGVLAFYLSIRLDISIDLTFDSCDGQGGFSFESCIRVKAAAGIPGFVGAVCEAGVCFPQGPFGICRQTGPSTIANMSLGTDTADEGCMALTQLTSPLSPGAIEAQLEVFNCCSPSTEVLIDFDVTFFSGTEVGGRIHLSDFPLFEAECTESTDFPPGQYHIQVVEFIPTEFVGPPVLFPLVHPTALLIGKGDDRGCRYDGRSYRVRQIVEVRAESDSATIERSFEHAADSEVYLWFADGDPVFLTSWRNGERGIREPTVEWLGPSSGFAVDVSGRARSRLSPFGFIDWCYRIQINPNADHYEITGGHDNYPAYEIYINGERVYCWTPLPGSDPFSLFGDCFDVSVNKSGYLSR